LSIGHLHLPFGRHPPPRSSQLFERLQALTTRLLPFTKRKATHLVRSVDAAVVLIAIEHVGIIVIPVSAFAEEIGAAKGGVQGP
jgi:hypothetical protein